MAEDTKPWHKFCGGGEGGRLLHSEKPHVFPEATYDVAAQNTCGFSTVTLADA